MTSDRSYFCAEPLLQITLEVDAAEPGTWPADDGTIARFLEWQLEADVLPHRTVIAGPGIYIALFDIGHKHALERFMDEVVADREKEPEHVELDGPCPFLSCTERGAHSHEVCPRCGAVWFGNFTCATCRAHRRHENQ